MLATGMAVETGVAAFDVERFAWVSPDRVEVAGRWFGVRGMRFMRPTLELQGAAGRRPLLALLEHKPWAPEDGALWVAAFPWEGEPIAIEGADLIVAPSLTVALPAPTLPGGKPPKPPKPSEARAEALRERAALERERDAAVEARDAALREREEVVRDSHASVEQRVAAAREHVEADLDQARSEADQLRADVAELEAGHAEVEQQLRARIAQLEAAGTDGSGELDALREQTATLLAERDEARRWAKALQQRARAAIAEREELTQTVEELRAQPESEPEPGPHADELLARALAAEAERDELRRKADQPSPGLASERDALLAEVAELRSRPTAQDTFELERSELIAERNTARRELKELRANYEAAVAERDSARAASASARRPDLTVPRPPSPPSPIALWGTRLLVLGALAVLLVVLLVLLRGA